jgi:hypothetical protein
MKAALSSNKSDQPASKISVRLNVYDLTSYNVYKLGLGAFHSGVEIDGEGDTLNLSLPYHIEELV